MAGAEHVGRDRAVDLLLGQARIPLRGQVEHQVRPDLSEDGGQAGLVPDVGVGVLRPVQPRPAIGQAAADTDQPPRMPLR